MHPCGMCGFQAFDEIDLVQHITRHHRFDANFQATCRFAGCGATYQKWASFKTHISRKHKYEAVPVAVPEQGHQPRDMEVEDIGYLPAIVDAVADIPGGPELDQETLTSVKNICLQYMNCILNIREGCNISQRATDCITEGIIQFSDGIMNALKAQLLQSADNDGKVSAASIQKTFEEFQLSNTIASVKSKHLLDKCLVETGFLILPEIVILAEQLVWMKKPSLHLASKTIHFYEVPFFPLLQQLLNQNDILHCVDNPRPPNNNGLLQDYQDGEFVKSHPIFGNNPTSLKIILYYDDVEIANPLGSKVKTHKLAMFYWSLGNIYPECQIYPNCDSQ